MAVLRPWRLVVMVVWLGLTVWQLAVLGGDSWPADVKDWTLFIVFAALLLLHVLIFPPVVLPASIPHGTALVTGASSGIGLELAKILVKEGHNVVLVARSAGRLESVAEECRTLNPAVTVTVVPKDLSAPNAAQELFDHVHGLGLEVSILVNNAGYGAHGKAWTVEPGTCERMVQLNCSTLVLLSHMFLPSMIQRGAGHILNVASTGAFQPVPYMAVYGATKAFVQSYSIALRYELAGTGVVVTSLCPGATATGFFEAASVPGTVAMLKSGTASAASVAREGYIAMARGVAYEITGAMNWIMGVAAPAVPYFISATVSKSLMK